MIVYTTLTVRNGVQERTDMMHHVLGALKRIEICSHAVESERTDMMHHVLGANLLSAEI